ncbi:hypothetical protein LQR31_18920 [Chromobacterium vaccinii]|uniref:hypothetical protein n=1 Tax=Chromobacterium vaccinii TaxID=1108595 RepID=UPI001E59641A|nr:hypothetical protein [Chromobacterium vaccinii]MCD4486552.1 hypothetical protein [Chromobacterium vaccinii]
MLNKFFLPLSSALFIGSHASAANISPKKETIKIDEHTSITLEYKKYNYERITLEKRGEAIKKIVFQIPKGRDPSKVGAEKYNKFLFSQPIKNKNSFFIPTLFALRTNSGSTNGQCGSGVEIWLKVIAVQGDLITIKSNELVQSCENDIYLQDNGNGKIEDAFQEDDGRIIVKWLSHPKNNGDSYSQSIQLD